MYTKLQLLEAFCRFHNYQAQISTGEEMEMIANPETKINFLKRTEREVSKRDAVSQLAMEARNLADTQAKESLKSIDL